MPEWRSKRGLYIHQSGCGAGPDEICTCAPPYPKLKEEHQVTEATRFIHFHNRERTGIAEVIDHGSDRPLHWMSVVLDDGERSSLNPALNSIRAASLEEIQAFNAKRFQVVVRLATQDDLSRTNANATIIDGAGAIEVNGTLVCITDEYGSAAWTHETLLKDLSWDTPISHHIGSTPLELVMDVASRLVYAMRPTHA